MAFAFHPPPPPLDRLFQSALSSYLSGRGSSNASADVPEKGTLAAVANSIRHCLSGMSPWDISDLTLGLYKIATRHALEATSDTISGSAVVDKDELGELLHWLDWAWASYQSDQKSVISFLKIEEEQLKKHTNTSAILKPAYFIAVDDEKRCVIMSIRGTYSATDVLTDLQPHSEAFEGGVAHSGMLSAARWILENELDDLQKLLSENAGYKLVLTGHSLGAGTASLLCFLLRESHGSGNQRVSSRLGIPSSMVHCWGFGCPPCVDRKLSEEAKFIKNVVLQDDIVARVSVASLEDLRSEILQTDWAHILEDGGTAKKMLNLVNSTQSALGSVERALGYEQGSFYQQAKSLSYAAFINSARASMARAPHGQYCSPAPYGMPGPPYSRGLQGPLSQNLAGWLSFGAAAVSSYLTVPDNRDQAHTASVSWETNSTSRGTSREFMESGRLFVPGILYHITRKSIEEKEESSINGSDMSNFLIETGGLRLKESNNTHPIKNGKNAEEESKSKGQKGEVPITARHTIIKGSEPASRFMKIVLSKSMLSDHSLVAYKNGIQDVISQIAEKLSV